MKQTRALLAVALSFALAGAAVDASHGFARAAGDQTTSWGNELTMPYQQAYVNGELSYPPTITYNDDGSVTVYVVYPDGTREEKTEWRTDDGQLIARTETFYDEQERIVRLIVTDVRNGETSISETTRVYNEDGGFTDTTVARYKDGSQRTRTQRYDAEGNYIFNELILPAGLTVIEEQAFVGSAVEAVVVPESVQSIGANAFSECWYLGSVEFGTASVDIEESAFENSSDPTLIAPAGGSVEAFASAHGLPFHAK